MLFISKFSSFVVRDVWSTFRIAVLCTGLALAGCKDSGELTGPRKLADMSDCADGQIVKFDAASNSWGCGEDIDTDTLGAMTTCADGGVAKWDAAGSAWGCGEDIDTDTLGALMTCTNAGVPKWNAAGSSWECGVDTDTDTLGSLTTCTDGGVAKWNSATNSWDCAFDINTDALAVLTTCANDGVAKWNSATNSWGCGEDIDTDTDTLGAMTTCADGGVAQWDAVGGVWECGEDKAPDHIFLRTIIVNPVGGAGNPIANGDALKSAVVKASTIIAADVGTKVLVKLEPGVYDLNNSALVLPTGVDLAGSSLNNTTIRSSVTGATTGVVQIATGSEIRDVEVQGLSGNTNALFIPAELGGVRIVDCWINGVGAVGIRFVGGGNLEMFRGKVTLTKGGIGMDISHTSSVGVTTLTNSTVDVTGSQGGVNIGIRNSKRLLTVKQSRGRALDGAISNIGIQLDDAQLRLSHSSAVGLNGAATTNPTIIGFQMVGFYSPGRLIYVTDSYLNGDHGRSVYMDDSTTGSAPSVRTTYSRLSGSFTGSPTDYTCAFTVGHDFTPVQANCLP